MQQINTQQIGGRIGVLGGMGRQGSADHGGTSRRVSLPFVAVVGGVHLGAILALFHYTHLALILCLVMVFITNCLGVSLGMHRLFSHRSFRVPKPLRYLLAVFATLAFQGTIRQWVGQHRMHHAGSDTPQDPHNIGYGFFYAHMGWLIAPYRPCPNARSIAPFARDIDADPVLRVLSMRWCMVVMQVSLGIGFYLWGGLPLVLWGTCVRLVICYHCTWLVNSACHMFGYQNHHIADKAKNNWWVALLSWGEGWHNNHHAYPDSAKTGQRWWELDLTYLVIYAFKCLKLASDVKVARPYGVQKPPLTKLGLRNEQYKPDSLHRVG